MNRSKLKTRLPLILAVLIFGSASLEAFTNQHIWWGLLNLFTTFANIIALKYSAKHPELIAVFLGVLNAVIAFTTAWVYIEEGKQYIQLVWILTGMIYLVVSYLFLNKTQEKYL